MEEILTIGSGETAWPCVGLGYKMEKRLMMEHY